MRILALETSGAAGSVAGLEDALLVQQVLLPDDVRSARSLAPSIRELMHRADWTPDTLDLIAVSEGPGSFTGLRVGVTTAKTLAYVTDALLLGVNTLEVIAAQAQVVDGRLWAALDAHRSQLFVARFVRDVGGDGPSWRMDAQTRVVDRDAWLRTLGPGDGVTGPGLSRLEGRLPDRVRVEDPACWAPQASTLGRIALGKRGEASREAVWNLVPQYYRRSAAEERWDG